MFEWHGQIAYLKKDHSTALDSLTRAASLGRESSVLWLILGKLNLEKDDLDLSIRYLKRSLELYRQPGLDIFQGRDDSLGFFIGEDPIKTQPESRDYLEALLSLLKISAGKHSLRAIRDFVLELSHQFSARHKLVRASHCSGTKTFKKAVQRSTCLVCLFCGLGLTI